MANMDTEESVGQVIFERSKEHEDEPELTHDQIFDDSLLIQHYDETMNKARRLLATKLSSATSLTDSECSNSHRTELVNGFSHCKLHAGGASNIKKKKKRKGRKKNEWHTGDPCKARYSEDGQIYEATIIGINNASGTCTVRFIGYNNHEEVAQSSLLKSNGEGARRNQMKEVTATYDQSEDTTEDSCAIDSDAPSENQRRSARHNRTFPNVMFPPPMTCKPPPTMPAPSEHSIPHIPDLPPPPALGLVDGPDPLTSEALHTMLMSWYMTGYHTGYYQGLNHGRNYSLCNKSATNRSNSKRSRDN